MYMLYTHTHMHIYILYINTMYGENIKGNIISVSLQWDILIYQMIKAVWHSKNA